MTKIMVSISPGHSDNHPGACAYGYREHDIARSITNPLFGTKYLNNPDGPVFVGWFPWLQEDKLWLEKTYTTQLRDRMRVMNSFRSHVAVEIHLNAANSVQANGLEIIYLSTKGKKLAECIQETFSTEPQTNNELTTKHLLLSWRRLISMATLGRYLYFLKATKMPAIIFEAGFITNDNDRNFLLTESGQDIMRNILVKGLSLYAERYL